MKVKDLLPQIYNALGAMAYAGCSAEEVADTEIVIYAKGEVSHVDMLAYSEARDAIVVSAVDNVD